MYAKNTLRKKNKCSQCKTVTYCCKDHQRIDWKNHKDICKAIASTEKLLVNTRVTNFQDFRTLQNLRCSLWQKFLKRKLERHEHQMWMFPRVCAVCYSSNCIEICKNCLHTAYCSDEHRMKHEWQHKQYCNALGLCMELDKINFDWKNYKIDISLKHVANNFKVLPSDIEKFIDLCDKNNTGAHRTDLLLRTGLISPVATILYGLEKSKFVHERFCMKSHLVIHIVGADITELANFSWDVMCELPLHWIKNLQRLKYYIIGPEIGHNAYVNNISNQLCEQCKSRKVEVNCEFISEVYHEVESKLEIPDLVVSFNSGLHENNGNVDDMWKCSIELLTKHIQVPLLLTAYTLDEILSDVAIAKTSTAVEEILTPQLNHFLDKRPIRDFDTENVPIFYRNGYIAILRRTCALNGLFQ